MSFEKSKISGELDSGALVGRLAKKLIETADLEQKQLNCNQTNHLSSLKTLLKENSELIETIVEAIFLALEKADSVTRLGAVILANELFGRSHKFREKIIDRLKDFLLFSAETDALRNPLPEPQETAKELKKFTLRIVKNWQDKYAPAYPRLNLAVQHLKQSKNSDFERLEAESQAERAQKVLEEQKKELLRGKFKAKIQSELELLTPEIQSCLTEMESAFELLCPQFSKEESKPSEAVESQEMTREHGLEMGEGLQLEIDLKTAPVRQNSDNQALFDILKDNSKLIAANFSPKIGRWLKNLSKIGGCDVLSKTLIDLKGQLAAAESKFRDLNLPFGARSLEEEESDDDDMEEVPEKEGLETSPPTDDLPSYLMRFSEKHKQTSVHESCQPSTSRQVAESSRTAALGIPVVGFGLDLKYWGREMEPPAIVKNNADAHRFWRPKEEDSESGDASRSEALANQTRVITFAGRFQAIEKECGAPLTDGKVCRRRDRVRCPFHGPKGEPPVSQQAKRPSWQDPELLRDIQAATGRNLEVGKRTKKRRESGRERLQTKLLDGRGMRRVGAALDDIQRARNQRTFTNNFNYTLSK